MADRPTSDPGRRYAFPMRIYWEDTDAGGIVFYANYLKFFERARTEWLRALGFDQQRLRDATGGIFVVHSTEVRYLRPARLDDQILVTAEVVECGRSGVSFRQQAWREAELLTEGRIRIAWVDAASYQPRRMPADVLAALQPPAQSAEQAASSRPASCDIHKNTA